MKLTAESTVFNDERIITDIDNARAAAKEITQHFWFLPTGEESGVHLTEVPQTEFLEDPSVGGSNLVAKSNGILVRDGTTELARFGSDAKIGRDDTGHTNIDSSGMRVYGGDGTQLLANIGYGEGTARSGTDEAPYYSLGIRSGTNGNYSVAEGYGSEASGFVSHAEGYYSEATGQFSHAEGAQCTASGGTSHAGGSHSEASGSQSFAHGFGASAIGANQVAIGLANEEDSSSLFLIGNGSYTVDSKTGQVIFTRSNAFVVESDGNIMMALNTSAASGTDDYALYQAIRALGWQSDVID